MSSLTLLWSSLLMAWYALGWTHVGNITLVELSEGHSDLNPFQSIARGSNCLSFDSSYSHGLDTLDRSVGMPTVMQCGMLGLSLRVDPVNLTSNTVTNFGQCVSVHELCHTVYTNRTTQRMLLKQPLLTISNRTRFAYDYDLTNSMNTTFTTVSTVHDDYDGIFDGKDQNFVWPGLPIWFSTVERLGLYLTEGLECIQSLVVVLESKITTAVRTLTALSLMRSSRDFSVGRSSLVRFWFIGLSTVQANETRTTVERTGETQKQGTNVLSTEVNREKGTNVHSTTVRVERESSKGKNKDKATTEAEKNPRGEKRPRSENKRDTESEPLKKKQKSQIEKEIAKEAKAAERANRDKRIAIQELKNAKEQEQKHLNNVRKKRQVLTEQEETRETTRQQRSRAVDRSEEEFCDAERKIKTAKSTNSTKGKGMEGRKFDKDQHYVYQPGFAKSIEQNYPKDGKLLFSRNGKSLEVEISEIYRRHPPKTGFSYSMVALVAIAEDDWDRDQVEHERKEKELAQAKPISSEPEIIIISNSGNTDIPPNYGNSVSTTSNVRAQSTYENSRSSSTSMSGNSNYRNNSYYGNRRSTDRYSTPPVPKRHINPDGVTNEPYEYNRRCSCHKCADGRLIEINTMERMMGIGNQYFYCPNGHPNCQGGCMNSPPPVQIQWPNQSYYASYPPNQTPTYVPMAPTPTYATPYVDSTNQFPDGNAAPPKAQPRVNPQTREPVYINPYTGRVISKEEKKKIKNRDKTKQYRQRRRVKKIEAELELMLQSPPPRRDKDDDGPCSPTLTVDKQVFHYTVYFLQIVMSTLLMLETVGKPMRGTCGVPDNNEMHAYNGNMFNGAAQSSSSLSQTEDEMEYMTVKSDVFIGGKLPRMKENTDPVKWLRAFRWTVIEASVTKPANVVAAFRACMGVGKPQRLMRDPEMKARLDSIATLGKKLSADFKSIEDNGAENTAEMHKTRADLETPGMFNHFLWIFCGKTYKGVCQQELQQLTYNGENLTDFKLTFVDLCTNIGVADPDDRLDDYIAKFPDNWQEAVRRAKRDTVDRVTEWFQLYGGTLGTAINAISVSQHEKEIEELRNQVQNLTTTLNTAVNAMQYNNGGGYNRGRGRGNYDNGRGRGNRYQNNSNNNGQNGNNNNYGQGNQNQGKNKNQQNQNNNGQNNNNQNNNGLTDLQKSILKNGINNNNNYYDSNNRLLTVCTSCGGWGHKHFDCWVWKNGIQCGKCKKKGHIEVVCKSGTFSKK